MGRALAAAAGLLVLCFAILGILVFATRQEDRVAVDSILAERITRAVAEAQQRGEDVELARYATFAWDEVLVVAADTPRSVISAELGFEFKGDLPYDAESGELFVFLNGGRLSRFADYRGSGAFAGLVRPIARLTAASAVFEVRDLVARPRR